MKKLISAISLVKHLAKMESLLMGLKLKVTQKLSTILVLMQMMMVWRISCRKLMLIPRVTPTLDNIWDVPREKQEHQEKFVVKDSARVLT